MTSLNQGAVNLPDGYAQLQIDENWRLMEKSAYSKKSESGWNATLVKTIPKEGVNI